MTGRDAARELGAGLLILLLSVGGPFTATASAEPSPANAPAANSVGDGPAPSGLSRTAGGASGGGVAEAEREAAQRLAEAQVLAIEGKWEQARLVFVQAYAVHPTSVVLWDLAVAEIKSEHFLEAAQHLQQYRRHPNAEPEKLARLKEYMGRVYAKIGRLQIDAPPAAVLWVDATRTEWTADDPVVTTAGEHSVVLSYGDQRLEKKVKVAQAAVVSISFRPPAPTTVPGAGESGIGGHGFRASDLDVNPPARSTATLPPRTIVLIAGASLTVASAVVGTVFALKGWSATTDATDQKDALGPATCTLPSAACAQLEKTNADAHSDKKIAGVAFIAAGALGVATLGTMLLWRTPRSSSIGIGADPTSVWVTGTF